MKLNQLKNFKMNLVVFLLFLEFVATKSDSINQKIDHFDPNNNGTWTQEYVIDKTYFTKDCPKSDPPIVILNLGGEKERKCGAPLPKEDCYDDYGFNVICLYLEHRYFINQNF